jgi:hypothetical protein
VVTALDVGGSVRDLHTYVAIPTVRHGHFVCGDFLVLARVRAILDCSLAAVEWPPIAELPCDLGCYSSRLFLPQLQLHEIVIAHKKERDFSEILKHNF